MSKLEKNLAELLGKSQDMDEEGISVLEFGIATIKSAILTICAVIFAGWLVGQLWGTLIILLTIAVLRTLTGGPHCTSEYRCALTSGLTIGFLSYLSPFIWPHLNLVLVSLLSLPLFISMLCWAPQDCPEKPINTPSHRRKLKTLGLIAAGVILVVQFFLVSNQFLPLATWIAEGTIWQALFLSPLGVWIIERSDTAMKRIGHSFSRRVQPPV